jgi:hypothetical protein
MGGWGGRKFGYKVNVVKAVKCFSSQNRRIFFYLPASIPADYKEGVITYFTDSVSQKNYHLSLKK